MSLELNKSGREKLQNLLFRKGLLLESLLKKNSPVFTGQYKNLWEAEKMDNGLGVKVVQPQGEKARALEYGGGEGEFPLVDQLRKWVRRKGLADGENEIDSAAYLIGRHIEQSGIKPQPHIRPSIREFKSREL